MSSSLPSDYNRSSSLPFAYNKSSSYTGVQEYRQLLTPVSCAASQTPRCLPPWATAAAGPSSSGGSRRMCDPSLAPPGNCSPQTESAFSKLHCCFADHTELKEIRVLPLPPLFFGGVFPFSWALISKKTEDQRPNRNQTASNEFKTPNELHIKLKETCVLPSFFPPSPKLWFLKSSNRNQTQSNEMTFKDTKQTPGHLWADC